MVFSIDFILRWMTADYKFGKSGVLAFVKYPTFFDAVYWSTVSLTTVGYGDIYPVTTVGRIVTMVSSVFGIAVIALPSGVITAGYMNEIAREERSREDDE